MLAPAHVRLDLEAKFGADLAINIVRDLRDDVFAAQFDDVPISQFFSLKRTNFLVGRRSHAPAAVIARCQRVAHHEPGS